MHVPIDLNKVIHRKGLDPNQPYIGLVIDDNDPEQLGRIRVRLPVFQDSIPDDKLPWAVPENYNHPEGLIGGEQRSGRFNGVPLRGHKVAVYFRHGGDANNPSYGPVPIDLQNVLPEFEVNYPYRRGEVTHDGFTFIKDSKTGEIFIHNPGDLNITILGDVNQTVVGNLQQKITASSGEIPSYLRNAPETVLSSLSANPQKKIPFEGLLGGDAGNYHVDVQGNMTMRVRGNMEEQIQGNYKRTVRGRIEDTSNSTYTMKGSRINLN